jgi:hypothetical protein
MTLLDDAPVGHADAGRLFELTETAAMLLATLTDVATALATTVTPRPPVPTGDQHGDGTATSDLLRAVLEGGRGIDVLAGRQGMWFLVCLTGTGSPAPSTGSGLTGLAAGLRPGSAATVLDGDVLVLAPYLNPDDALLLAERLRERFAHRLGRHLVACLSEPFDAGLSGSTADPAALCRTVRRAATVLAAAVLADSGSAGTGRAAELPLVRTTEQLRPHVLLAELAELAAGSDSLSGGPVEILREHDVERGTDFLGSLLAYFDAGGDVTEAARRLHVHRNTLRYRLQRIEELTGTGLSTAPERFTLELQVRVYFVRANRFHVGTTIDG